MQASRILAWSEAVRPHPPPAAPGPSASSRIRRLWRRWDRMVLGALALASFALGCWGASIGPDDSNFSPEGWHPVSTALKLFFVNGPSAGHLPWQLEVARLLAPTVTIYAAIATVLSVASERWVGFRVARLARTRVKPYTVVIGLGNIGSRLVADFRRREAPSGSRLLAFLLRRPRVRPIVVLERDADGIAAQRARELGAVVVKGDALRPEDVAAVHPEMASLVTVFCGDDALNLAVLARIRALRAGYCRRFRGDDRNRAAGAAPTRPPPVYCAVHVSDARLRRLVSATPSPKDDELGLRVEYVGLYEEAARRACADVLAPAFGRPGRRDGPVHLLVVGLGQMGEELILEAARSPHAVLDGPCLHVTVVDRDADARVSSLQRRFPALSEDVPAVGLPALTRLHPQGLEVLDGAQLARLAEELDAGGTRPPVAAIAVCLEQEAVGLAIARDLLSYAKPRGIPVLLRLSNERGLADVVRCDGLPAAELAHVCAFAVLDDLGTTDLVEGSRTEHAVHETYRQAVELEAAACEPATAAPAGTAATPSGLPPRPAAAHAWDSLPRTYRESCRAQARHVPWKLARLDLGVARADGTLGASIPAAEVEPLAKLEHARWVAERRLQGWTPGPKRDDAQRVHPDLRPWDDRLPLRSKAFDVAAVRAIPHLVEAAGLVLVPRNG